MDKVAIDYLKIGRASELTGRDRRLYRFLEILPRGCYRG